MEFMRLIHAKNKLGFGESPTSAIFSLKITWVKYIIVINGFLLCFVTHAIYFVFIIVH